MICALLVTWSHILSTGLFPMPQGKSVDFLFMVTLCLAWPKPPSQSGWTGNTYETTRNLSAWPLVM